MAFSFYRRLILAFGSVVFGLSSVQANEGQPERSYQLLNFSDLEGWNEDNHAAALVAFNKTCQNISSLEWETLCAFASHKPDAKHFFERFFRPVLIEDGNKALFTGYFEPELNGSLTKTERYKYPVYEMPPEAQNMRPWLTRREILTGDAMNNRDLEIAWVDDPVELFFLQIQGSGRIHLNNDEYIRIGYGGSNGHPYKSIGREMVRQGIYEPHQVSAQVIKNWVKRNPVDGRELLFHSPSYVFFRRVDEVPGYLGPLGAMNRSITKLRSIAVDPAFTKLGAPVWIEKAGRNPMRRLMIAQDTGSAIKGAQRADVFMGTGHEAGVAAGKLRDPGRMVVLLPIQEAYSLAPEEIR